VGLANWNGGSTEASGLVALTSRCLKRFLERDGEDAPEEASADGLPSPGASAWEKGLFHRWADGR